MVTRKIDLATVRVPENSFGYNNKKKYLTIHQTGNTAKGADAQMHATYQKGRIGEKSWHWQVDDRVAIQSFQHNVSCYHASDGSGDGNMNSIAIEGCINSDGNYKKSVQNMAELAAWILKTENIPLSNMKQHYDWARDKKNCPTQIRAGKDGINWYKFVQMVQAELNKLNGKPTVEKPVVESAKAYKVVATINGYVNATDAKAKKNAKTKVKAGNYTVFKESNGMINVTSKAGVAGNWINPEENKAPSTPAKPSVTAEVIAKSYAENETLIPDRTINVYDKPSKAAKVVATYYKNEPVTYHKVHIGKQNIWIQYTRDGGKGEGYMPVQNVVNGKGQGLFGTIKPKAAAKAKKTYVKLAAHEPTWTVYALGQQPIATNSTKKLAPRQYGGLEYEVLGYEDNGQCAIIQTQAFGRCKIFIKDPSATIYTK